MVLFMAPQSLGSGIAARVAVGHMGADLESVGVDVRTLAPQVVAKWRRGSADRRSSAPTRCSRE